MNIDDLYRMSGWVAISPVFLVLLCLACFVGGWLFPVEGPLDYIYDNHVKKVPSKVAPALKSTETTELEFSCDDLQPWEPNYVVFCEEGLPLD